MSKTILIGYEIKIGTFTSDKTGEVIPYNNRVLRFISDTGSSETDFGFSQFTIKLKIDELAKYLGLAVNDNHINDFLRSNVHKEFEIDWRAVNNTLECRGIRLKKSS